MDPELHQKQPGQKVEGDSIPLLYETSPGVLGTVLVSPA